MTQGRVRPDALDEWLRGDGLATLEAITGGAPDVLGVMDRQFIIRYVNWTAPGLTREQVVGHSVFNLIPPGYEDLSLEAFQKVLNTGATTSFETMYQGEQGVLIWLVRAGPIRHAGEVIGVVTLNSEVTEQRRGEADRDRFFALSRDTLVVLTPDGRFKRLNPAFGTLLGYDPTELVGRKFSEFVHPDDLEHTLRRFQEAQAMGTSDEPFENRYRRSDGTYRVLSWLGVLDPVTGDGYAVARDITEQRMTEARLHQAQKMEAVGQLAGGIAHDFNNLMQAVIATADLALAGDANPPHVVESLHEIARAGQRAAELTRQLLLFSRRQALRRVKLDLDELTTGFMRLLRRLLPENIRVELTSERGQAVLSADRTQLEQVLLNLCVNARDAMEGGGKLSLLIDTVTLESNGTLPSGISPGVFVRLRVCDTGCGMPPDVVERVFEPFFTTKEPHRGTGLGLATVYGIVQHHGGFIQVDSVVGVGTTFTVHLPAEAAVAVGPRSGPPKPLDSRGRETILVVEDEELVRKPVTQVLERAGFRTLSAPNGAAAVRLLRDDDTPVDLVLLDVVMPELGGPETWERLRVLRPAMRVLFTSGYAAEQYRERLPPGTDVLEKPFRGEELLLRIRERLDG